MNLAEQVLYEDNHLIVLNKLPGQIVQGDKTGDTPLSELVKEFIKVRDQKPGNVFVGVVHRLDRPVSGVVVFAKTSKALSRMNELFKMRETEKTYWAVVKNKPEKESGTLVHYLMKNEKQNKSYASVTEKKGSLRCELNYRLLSKSDNYYLLEVKPQTGRHHQIRVQLASMGCTIKGDLKYGFARSNPDGSIHLHARALTFVHPIKQESIQIEAAVPNEKVWKTLEENCA
ncbi:MAG: RNA pseudouridine synthase [Bacteroidia bacterium]|nr:RNA pseudouridine synthase [Bacteroidia bacterium]